MQQGDVPKTFADISEIMKDFGYRPNTSINKGLKEFITWYKVYHNVDLRIITKSRHFHVLYIEVGILLVSIKLKNDYNSIINVIDNSEAVKKTKV